MIKSDITKHVIVYRETDPYPVRHIIKYTDYKNPDDFFKWYHEIFYANPDDTIAVFDTMQEAILWEQELACRYKQNLVPLVPPINHPMKEGMER